MIALALYTGFLMLAVAGRIALHYHLVGDHGIRVSKQRSLDLLFFVQTLLALSLVGTFVISCLQAADLIRPQVDLGAAGNHIGMVLSLLGMAITALAQFQMGASWRIGVDESESTNLVTHGLYSRVRNPIYMGVMLFGIGLLFLIPHVYMFLFLVAAYLSIELQVRRIEEPHLRRQHGVAYEEYYDSTGRYLPKIGRYCQ